MNGFVVIDYITPPRRSYCLHCTKIWTRFGRTEFLTNKLHIWCADPSVILVWGHETLQRYTANFSYYIALPVAARRRRQCRHYTNTVIGAYTSGLSQSAGHLDTTRLWLCPSLPTETLKWLSSLPILKQKSFWWWQCSDRYIISLPPPPPSRPPPPLWYPFPHKLYAFRVLGFSTAALQ